MSFLSGAASVRAACTVIPPETAGPYPGDGTNGPNVLTQSGIVRQDIRSSFGSAGAATSTGVLLTVRLQLANTNGNCGSLAGYLVYLWHCDALGRYSLYSSGVSTQNYLRGVQVSDANGWVSFTTIFPGCYSGRWPHIHFEVYASSASAVSGSNAISTSQIALPQAESSAVYTAQADVYTNSTSNLSRISLASDNVFRDTLAATQLASMSGSVANGYVATLSVGIAGPTVTATVPEAPTLINAFMHHYLSAGLSNILLEFSAPVSNGGSAIIDYLATIECSGGTGCTLQTTTLMIPANQTRVTLEFSRFSTYSIRLQARNAVGLSVSSNAVNAVVMLALVDHGGEHAVPSLGVGATALLGAGVAAAYAVSTQPRARDR